jgi:hypothetical protein
MVSDRLSDGELQNLLDLRAGAEESIRQRDAVVPQPWLTTDAVPALVAEVRRLRAALAGVVAEAEHWRSAVEDGSKYGVDDDDRRVAREWAKARRIAEAALTAEVRHARALVAEGPGALPADARCATCRFFARLPPPLDPTAGKCLRHAPIAVDERARCYDYQRKEVE